MTHGTVDKTTNKKNDGLGGLSLPLAGVPSNMAAHCRRHIATTCVQLYVPATACVCAPAVFGSTARESNVNSGNARGRGKRNEQGTDTRRNAESLRV